MIEQIPAGADRVAFSFVQFNKDKFPNQYQELAQFDGNSICYIIIWINLVKTLLEEPMQC